MKRLHLHIEDIPSSNNKYQGQGSKNKAIKEYRQEKNLWSQYIWIIRSKMKKRGELDGWQLPLDQGTIIMRYNFKTRSRRDPDNYSGKFILDGLKDWGFISDDSFKEIDIFPMATYSHPSNSVDIFIFHGKKITEIVGEMIQ